MAPDQAIAALAANQYGVFTRAQAFELGFSRRMIDHRLKSGRWEAVHPNVYAFAGSGESWRRQQIAACFWSSGVAARKAAGHLYGLPGCEEPGIEIVTLRDRRVMPMCGVIAHVTKRLPRDQVAIKESIPLTSIERTLMDLCGELRSPRAAMCLTMRCIKA